ncbi:hypothetical protein Ahy_B09g097897 [Arachis hypogaea]|uniref:Uncharacterized protein n=1 Tax=Arachis hypogaea TaxID=3818 RepID=A0A444XQ97_ARAHY|nr:hypothetical protein Ahy_B09g097897 [Arachis hypogaea]
MTELPNYIKPKLSLDYIKNSINYGLDNYYTKYIKTNFTDPIYHICFGVMALSYLVNLPEKRYHYESLKHERVLRRRLETTFCDLGYKGEKEPN